jgi:plasmid stabilization system protein ParE
MSADYRLTPRAAADLDDILEHYLREADASVAERVVAEFDRNLRLLAANRYLGRRRDDLVPDLVRFWAVYSYFVVYNPDETPLLIARIIHAQRELRVLFLE